MKSTKTSRISFLVVWTLTLHKVLHLSLYSSKAMAEISTIKPPCCSCCFLFTKHKSLIINDWNLNLNQSIFFYSQISFLLPWKWNEIHCDCTLCPWYICALGISINCIRCRIYSMFLEINVNIHIVFSFD